MALYDRAADSGHLGLGQIFIRKRSLLRDTLDSGWTWFLRLLCWRQKAGWEDDVLFAQLPLEKQLLSDPLIKASHPERSGCCKLP